MSIDINALIDPSETINLGDARSICYSASPTW